jgi:hypothetical protein
LTLENLGHFGFRIYNISELHGRTINGVGTLKRKTLDIMDLKYNKDGLTIEYEWNTWTLKRQIILDLMDLEDNIDGLIIKYERNVGF